MQVEHIKFLELKTEGFLIREENLDEQKAKTPRVADETPGIDREKLA